MSLMFILYRKIAYELGVEGYSKEPTSKSQKNTSRIQVNLSDLLNNRQVKDFVFFFLHIRNLISLKKISSLLDVGCGIGTYSLLFSGKSAPIKGFRYTGIDISGSAINIAKKSFLKSTFIQGDMLKLLFKNGSYDLLYASGSLQYAPQKWRKALLEFSRVSKKYIILDRLPLTKENHEFVVRQSVISNSGLDVRNFIIANRDEFEDYCSKLRLLILSRDATSEIIRIPGVSEHVLSYQYLLKKEV